jgi:hypothetical protein
MRFLVTLGLAFLLSGCNMLGSIEFDKDDCVQKIGGCSGQCSYGKIVQELDYGASIQFYYDSGEKDDLQYRSYSELLFLYRHVDCEAIPGLQQGEE